MEAGIKESIQKSLDYIVKFHDVSAYLTRVTGDSFDATSFNCWYDQFQKLEAEYAKDGVLMDIKSREQFLFPRSRGVCVSMTQIAISDQIRKLSNDIRQQLMK